MPWLLRTYGVLAAWPHRIHERAARLRLPLRLPDKIVITLSLPLGITHAALLLLQVVHALLLPRSAALIASHFFL
jgi:hypothetical protein